MPEYRYIGPIDVVDIHLQPTRRALANVARGDTILVDNNEAERLDDQPSNYERVATAPAKKGV